MIPPFRGSDKAASFAPIDPGSVRAYRDWFVGLGVVLVVLGLFAILLPFFASLVTIVTLGWLMVLAGVSEGYHAMRTRAWGGSGWALLSAAVQVVAGFLVVIFPLAGKLVLTAILTVYLIVEGGLKLVRAAQHRRMQASGWLVFDGLLSVVLGILILAHWPSSAVWVLGLFIGVNLLIGGTSMLLLGLGSRREARA